MKRLLCVAVLAGLSGCATNNQVWDKPGSGTYEFNMDQGQCRAQAFSVPGAPPVQIALVYDSCMRGKGWNLIDQPRR